MTMSALYGPSPPARRSASAAASATAAGKSEPTPGVGKSGTSRIFVQVDPDTLADLAREERQLQALRRLQRAAPVRGARCCERGAPARRLLEQCCPRPAAVRKVQMARMTPKRASCAQVAATSASDSGSFVGAFRVVRAGRNPRLLRKAHDARALARIVSVTVSSSEPSAVGLRRLPLLLARRRAVLDHAQRRNSSRWAQDVCNRSGRPS
jgi:hypothetical protein